MTRPVSKRFNKVRNLAQEAPMTLHTKALLPEPKQPIIEGKQAVDDMPGADTHPDVETPACSPRTGLSSGVSIVDWDEMFSAVKERLSHTVGGPIDAMTEAQVHDAAGRVRNSVLECVEALDQLQTILRAEIERCRQLEMPAREA
jgi:hypothetical protein